MKPHHLLALSLSFALPSASTLAQDAGQAGGVLPPSCQQPDQMAANMPGMTSNMQTMPQGEANQLSAASTALLQSIMAMHGPMMRGAMAQDPDMAFTCSMIAHHLGAIAMAGVELKYGKDEQAKAMAQKTIDAQSKEVEEMTKWVETHAAK